VLVWGCGVDGGSVVLVWGCGVGGGECGVGVGRDRLLCGSVGSVSTGVMFVWVLCGVGVASLLCEAVVLWYGWFSVGGVCMESISVPCAR